MGVEFANSIGNELNYKVSRRYFWSDSTTVLNYIRCDDKRFNRFVANKISFIRNYTIPNDWHFVPSEANPADLISRGATVKYLSSCNLWLNVPNFLNSLHINFSIETPCNPGSLDEEVKKTTCHVSCVSIDNPLDILMNASSDWYKLKLRISWLLKLKNALRERTNLMNAKISADDLEVSETAIIKYVQNKYFSSEITKIVSKHEISKSSNLRKLTPFLDESGVLRVGGRLGKCQIEYAIRHPIVLPGSSPIVKLLVRWTHCRVGHLGRETTLSYLRKKYWVIKANSITRNILNNCVICRKYHSKPLSQQMSDLPPVRVTGDLPAFAHTGVDLFGPFDVTNGRKVFKRYGVVFTCMNSRAIHLEIAYTLDTDSFVNALRRFVCRRGNNIKSITSDNGTNLRSGERELREALNQWNQTHIESWLKQNHIEWRFNPPTASNFGSAYERLIRSVRKVINTTFRQQIVRCTDEDLVTLLCEVECILNNRPLTKISDDPADVDALTPNHLLLCNSCVTFPPGLFKKEDSYLRRRWRQLQYVADVFWSRWRKEYLVLLNERQKWHNIKRNLKVGDIVLVTDLSLPRNQWPLARVIEIFPDNKGLVRSVILKVSKCRDNNVKNFNCVTLHRPISKIVFLPCD